MKKDNLDHIIFTIEQAKKAEEFGFSRNHCCRNLRKIITPYCLKRKGFPKMVVINELMGCSLEKEVVEKILSQENMERIYESHVTKKDNLCYIMFAIKQVKETLLSKHKEHKINLDLTLRHYWDKLEKGWRKHSYTTPRSIEAKGKSTGIVAEHPVPINIVMEKIIQASSEEDVREILEKYQRVALITDEEDDKLKEIGLNAKMPDDWDGEDPWARYKKAGIKLVDGYPS